MQHTPGPWYARTSNHQIIPPKGLIVSEETGENIAVAYDKKNAPILAAAPDLLEALEHVTQSPEYFSFFPGTKELIESVIKKAKGD